jgi:hypothetical protein
VPEYVVHPYADIFVDPFPVDALLVELDDRIFPNGNDLLLNRQFVEAAAERQMRRPDLALHRNGIAARGGPIQAEGRQGHGGQRHRNYWDQDARCESRHQPILHRRNRHLPRLYARTLRAQW